MEDVLCVVIIEEREVNFSAVLALQNELVTEDLRALEYGLSEHEVKDTLPLLVGQRRIKFCSIKCFKLNFEVCH